MHRDRPMTDAFLSLAPAQQAEDFQSTFTEAGGVNGWMVLQGAFQDMVDRYLAGECAKDVELNIGDHEAGGQWRIAFPHAGVRPDAGVERWMRETMTARRSFTDRSCFHGYPDCTEVHHEIETFIYFRMPLYYHGMAGADDALRSIEDVAHHTGNWVEAVPEWYDWKARGFRSIWFGTKGVRAHPPPTTTRRGTTSDWSRTA